MRLRNCNSIIPAATEENLISVFFSFNQRPQQTNDVQSFHFLMYRFTFVTVIVARTDLLVVAAAALVQSG